MRLAIFAAAALALTACKGPPEESTPPPSPAPTQKMPDWKAAISHSATFDSAQNTVVVQVKVAPGFHAYTTGETTGKPLLLSIADDSDFVLDGDVEYPQGTEKMLPVGRSVIVEGTADVKAKVKAKADDAKTVRGTFRYQVCTDEACDRPRTAKLELPAS